MKEFATLDKAIELVQQGYAVYPLIENTKKPPKGVAGQLKTAGLAWHNYLSKDRRCRMIPTLNGRLTAAYITF